MFPPFAPTSVASVSLSLSAHSFPLSLSHISPCRQAALSKEQAAPLWLPGAASPTPCPCCLPKSSQPERSSSSLLVAGWAQEQAGRLPDHLMGAPGKNSLSWGQAFPSRGFIRPDRGGRPAFPKGKAAVPWAARKSDTKMSASVSPPWCMPARRTERSFSSLWCPCQGARARWEQV